MLHLPFLAWTVRLIDAKMQHGWLSAFTWDDTEISLYGALLHPLCCTTYTCWVLLLRLETWQCTRWTSLPALWNYALFTEFLLLLWPLFLSLAWLLLCGIINQAGPKKSDLSYSSSAAASLVAYETMLGKSPCRLFVLVIVHRPLSTCSSPLPSTPPLQRYNNNTIPQTRIKSCPDCPQQQQLHILYMPIRASKRYLILHESSADPLITINWSPGLVVVGVLIFFDYARVHYLLPENEEYNIIVLFDLSTKASTCLGANWSSEQTANGGGV